MFFPSRFQSKLAPFLVFSILSLSLPLILSEPASASDDPGPAYERGRKTMSHGDLAGAVIAFTEAIGLNGQNGLAYLRRGECYYRLNSFAEAQKDFSKAIEIAPESASAYIWRGTVNGRTGDEAASVADYKKAIELNRSLAVNYFKNATNEKPVESGKLQRARLVGNRIVMTNQNNVEVYRNNVSCVQFYKEAMNALYPNGFTDNPSTLSEYKEPLSERHLISDGQNITLRDGGVFPGADEYHGPDIKASLTALNDQIRSDSTNSAYYYQRAKVFQKMMKVENAIRDYNTAISLEPNRAQYYVGKASLYQQLGKQMKVDALVQKARSVDPTVPHVIKFAVEPYPASFKWTGTDD